MKLFILLIFIPAIAFAYTDVEVMKLIDQKISGHSDSLIKIVSLFMAIAGILFGWLFYLINSNRRLTLDLESNRHKEHRELMRKMEESFDHVNEKINKHTLHVANHYIRDEKVEKMLERAVHPLHEQMKMFQQTMNNYFSMPVRVTEKNGE